METLPFKERIINAFSILLIYFALLWNISLNGIYISNDAALLFSMISVCIGSIVIGVFIYDFPKEDEVSVRVVRIIAMLFTLLILLEPFNHISFCEIVFAGLWLYPWFTIITIIIIETRNIKIINKQ